MTEVAAWLRERMPWVRFGPVAGLIGLLGGPPVVERLGLVALAWCMLASFRLRDDLADRPRDAVEHPQRVLVRAASLRPFWRALLLGLAIGFVGLSLAFGLARGLGLLALALAFELGYRARLGARHRWVLLKYPLLAALLADSLAPTLAGLCYLGFVVYERLDDAALRGRPDAGARLAGYLLLAGALAWVHLVWAEASLAWFLALGGLWGGAVAAARAGKLAAGMFAVTTLIWAQDNLRRVEALEVGPVAQALWLTLPVTCAGLTHVWVIRRDLLPRLASIRLDAGLSLRGRPLFGRNKTLRGAIVMIGACVVWTAIFDLIQRVAGLDEGLRYIPRAQLGSLGLGLLLGIAYILGELPNSMIKRQLDVAPGEAGRGWARPLVWLVDQLDSAVAIVLALALLRPPTPSFVLTLLIAAVIVHPAVAALMVALGLKRRIG